MNLFKHPWYADKPMGRGQLKIIHQGINTPGKGGAIAYQNGTISAGSGKYMGQGQKKKRLFAFIEITAVKHRLGRGGNVIMGKHHPLGNPRGS